MRYKTKRYEKGKIKTQGGKAKTVSHEDLLCAMVKVGKSIIKKIEDEKMCGNN